MHDTDKPGLFFLFFFLGGGGGGGGGVTCQTEYFLDVQIRYLGIAYAARKKNQTETTPCQGTSAGLLRVHSFYFKCPYLLFLLI